MCSNSKGHLQRLSSFPHLTPSSSYDRRCNYSRYQDCGSRKTKGVTPGACLGGPLKIHDCQPVFCTSQSLSQFMRRNLCNPWMGTESVCSSSNLTASKRYDDAWPTNTEYRNVRLLIHMTREVCKFHKPDLTDLTNVLNQGLLSVTVRLCVSKITMCFAYYSCIIIGKQCKGSYEEWKKN